jgi:hypothetical protein
MIEGGKTAKSAIIFFDKRVGKEKTRKPWYEGYVSSRR